MAGGEEKVKDFYRSRSETNWVRRFNSPSVVRRYFFRTMWDLVAQVVGEAPLVLDAGCGDGVLAVLMALRHPGRRVVALDISEEGVRMAREAARAHGVLGKMFFVVGDAEHLPFKDGVFPAVVSCHVLEHLPDFDCGVKEIRRVLRADGVGAIAVPCCLNPSVMALLGKDTYWRISKRTLFAIWLGLARVVKAWLKGEEGVQEGYAGREELPHLRRFPWRAVRRIERGGLKVVRWMADSLLIPYIGHLFPSFMRLQRLIDERLRDKSPWRNFGQGIVMEVRKERRGDG